jgi:diacylglycerol kinase family enzyme
MKSGSGNYVESPGVRELQVDWMRIKLDRPSPAHTDGDIFSTGIQQLTYRIHPGRISVLAV